ncbi:MAG TPA: hypothetical protein VFS43_47425 [Polyangiaceae bacterium]|nr:hypothetical protein [Polyangiaceae bacterium]
MALAGAGGCRQLAGIGDVGCAPGCSVDGLVRLECEADGRVRAVTCGEGSSCRDGECLPCIDRCDGPSARFVCANGPSAPAEPCPADTPYCLAGACVECLGPGDCSVIGEACVEAACEGGRCAARPVEAEARRKAPDPMPGDCVALFCNGTAEPFGMPDASDGPDDGNECTTERCAEALSEIVRGFAPDGARCRGGEGRCDGGGRCQTVRRLASRGDFTCALMSDGAVWCWGANDAGQLGSSPAGDPPGANSARPVRVPNFGLQGGNGLRVPVGEGDDHTLVASTRFACALAEPVSSGRPTAPPAVYCWGGAAAGQNNFTKINLPADRVPVSLATGQGFACVLSGDRRSIDCWGEAGQGQLGTGTVLSGSYGQPQPVAMPLMAPNDDVVSLAAGQQHACIALSDGRVFCWGSNLAGQLSGPFCPCPGGCEPPQGPECTQDRSFGPVEVGPLPLQVDERVVRVAAGPSATCALTSAGRALCWGRNGYGELGLTPSAFVVKNAPAPMQTFDGAGESDDLTYAATAAFGDGQHACGLATDGAAFCWGSAVDGQVVALPGGALPPGCGTFGGATICLPSLARAPLFSGRALDVVAGIAHSCALLEDAAVWCWGNNQYGQRGDGSFSSLPVPDVGPTKVVWPWSAP